MEPSLKRKAANQPEKLHRHHLPFYMQPPILVSFIVVSVAGQVAWTAAVNLSRVDTSWCGVGFAAGVVLGFIQGKWTTRMWARDYMRVLTREITFWDARGAKGTTIFVILALGMPILFGLLIRQTYGILAGLQSYVFGFVGGMNLALVLVGATVAPVTGVREALQRRAKASDVQGFINEHSLRVGMTVSLAKRETSLVEVQNAGRRKTSRMSAHYASAELVSQGAVDRHFEDDE